MIAVRSQRRSFPSRAESYLRAAGHGGSNRIVSQEVFTMIGAVQEIVLPDGEPEYEWVRGRTLQKVSPASIRSFVQSTLLVLDGAPAARRRPS